jgi:hypothetical protein
MHWVSEATSTYLTEAGHQVRAVGVLVGAEVVATALDPLVRGVLERAGRVKWILAADISPEKRGARAGLEWGVSLSAYRRGLDWPGVPTATRKQWQTEVRKHRAKLEALFCVERPPSNPCDLESRPSTEISQWLVAGESYPNYGRNAEYALENDSTTRRQGLAWYDGLCGFSHPSVIFSREHRAVDVDGRVTYTYPYSDLEKSVRVAALGLLDAARHWMAYYGAGPDAFQRRVDALADRLKEISVIA